jgi:His-Xaa-Ser system protein HxsD
MAEVVIEFAAGSQSIGALREAAYRLIGTASCQIDTLDGAHRCRLEPAPKHRISEHELRARFIDLVTDENLREKIAAATEPTRNVILALAFGALAKAADGKG